MHLNGAGHSKNNTVGKILEHTNVVSGLVLQQQLFNLIYFKLYSAIIVHCMQVTFSNQ